MNKLCLLFVQYLNDMVCAKWCYVGNPGFDENHKEAISNIISS